MRKLPGMSLVKLLLSNSVLWSATLDPLGYPVSPVPLSRLLILRLQRSLSTRFVSTFGDTWSIV